MNTTKRTETKDMQPGLALAVQIPSIPEPQFWIGVFKHNERTVSMERRTFRALGLSCKALFEIFLPREISLCKREIELRHAEDEARISKSVCY